MITDLWDVPAAWVRAGFAPRASARSSSGRLRPPMASPPSLRNSRRVRPSQYRLSPPGPHKVSMIDPSPRGRTGLGRLSSRAALRCPTDVKQYYNPHGGGARGAEVLGSVVAAGDGRRVLGKRNAPPIPVPSPS